MSLNAALIRPRSALRARPRKLWWKPLNLLKLLKRPGPLKPWSVLPGFSLSLGYTVFYLGLLVLIPLAALVAKAAALPEPRFWTVMTDPRVIAAFRLSFRASALAAGINMPCGLVVAWVLVRYPFPGKRLVDGLVDLPFALPTAVAGICLTALYAPDGWLGSRLQPLGIRAAFSPLGVVIALTFIGVPFVIRTVQPVLQDLDAELEEAAAILGASQWQTFVRVILPHLLPALLTGFALAFARACGEYGSVVFISGNLPMKTETVPLLIMTKLEEFDYPAAAAIGIVMLAASFILLFLINGLQLHLSRRRRGS